MFFFHKLYHNNEFINKQILCKHLLKITYTYLNQSDLDILIYF